MKPNKSNLRKGSQEEREKLCITRIKEMENLRQNECYTWAAIGRRFKITRQAACKFYTENKYLLKLKG